MGSVFGKVPIHCQGGFVFLLLSVFDFVSALVFVLIPFLGELLEKYRKVLRATVTRERRRWEGAINSANYFQGIIKSHKNLHSKAFQLEYSQCNILNEVVGKLFSNKPHIRFKHKMQLAAGLLTE